MNDRRAVLTSWAHGLQSFWETILLTNKKFGLFMPSPLRKWESHRCCKLSFASPLGQATLTHDRNLESSERSLLAVLVGRRAHAMCPKVSLGLERSLFTTLRTPMRRNLRWSNLCSRVCRLPKFTTSNLRLLDSDKGPVLPPKSSQISRPGVGISIFAQVPPKLAKGPLLDGWMGYGSHWP